VAKEYSVKDWQSLIRQGLKFQESYGDSKNWERYKKYYRQQFRSDIVPVNLVFAMLRSMVPQVYFRNPKIVVTPTRPGLLPELNARVIQRVDNWLLREIGLKQQYKRMIQDAFLCGTASGVLGYDSLFGFDTEQAGRESMTLSQFDDKGNKIEYNSNVSPGMPWFLRARPEDIVYPWGCTGPDNARWYAMRVMRPLDDVRADSKYKKSVANQLKGSYVPQVTTADGVKQLFQTTDGEPNNNTVEWVELFEIHDSATGKVYVITMQEGMDKFLRDDTDEMQIDGLGIETITFNPDSDYIYGVPDAKILEPQMLELTDIRTQAQKHRRIDILKMLVRKGALSKQELEKITSSSVGAFAEIETEGVLGDNIVPMSPGVSGILNDLAQQGLIVKQEANEIIGVPRTAQGAYQGKTHVSASEVDQVAASFGIRLDERRDIVADSILRVMRRVNQLIFTRWTTDRVTDIIGPDGARWWIKYTGPQVRDEYNITIELEDAAPLDTATKIKNATMVADTWAKLNQGQIQAGMPVPPEIQHMLFAPFSDVNLDKLMAQTVQQPPMPGMGASPGQAVNPAQLAAMMQGGRGGAMGA
jgi:hypothetical protein